MLSFQPLDLEAKETIQAFTARYDSYSDFNFVSLYTWNVDGSIEYCVSNDVLLLKMPDYITGEPFVTCLGGVIKEELLEEIKSYCKELGLDPTMKLVPEVTAKAISIVQPVEDLDSDDYLLSVELLMEMRANLFRGKRNLLNRFNRFYGEVAKCRLLDLGNKTESDQVVALNTLWREKTTQTREETETEYHAINRALSEAARLEVHAYGVYVGSELIAYSIFEILPKNGSMLHFEKSDHDYIGAGEYLKNKFAHHVHETHGTTWINYEQDLGIENLRRTKESYKPTGKLKKYIVSL